MKRGPIPGCPPCGDGLGNARRKEHWKRLPLSGRRGGPMSRIGNVVVKLGDGVARARRVEDLLSSSTASWRKSTVAPACSGQRPHEDRARTRSRMAPHSLRVR